MPQHPRLERTLLAAAVAAPLLALGAWINASMITEAYGDGPPYYGRSTNMDKWSDPTRYLIGLDAVLLGAVGAAFWWARRRPSP